MAYYLCIDGGGTKTSAFVAHVPPSGAPVVAVGHAGASNLYVLSPSQTDDRTFGLDACLSATTEAVSNAVSALAAADPSSAIVFPFNGPPTPPLEPSEGGARFARVWAGYAGCVGASNRALLGPPLAALLGLSAESLRLTGDGELLTAPAVKAGVRRFVTLICGTGSLALLWKYEGGAEQLARSGGWGPLLDDAGSGWALGKEAVKSVLTFNANARPFREWHEEVLAHFGLDGNSADRLIAASSQLRPSLSQHEGDNERKHRIAACSRIVVAAAEAGDDEATRLLRVVAGQVCTTLEPLVSMIQEDTEDAEDAMLVVAGGLGQVGVFWAEVEAQFRQRGWRWAHVEKVPEPGKSGLDLLLAAA